MTELIITNDTVTIPLFVSRPDSGRPNILEPRGGSARFDSAETGRYIIRSETSQAIAFSVGTPLEAEIKVTIAGPSGSPGGVITFTNPDGPAYFVRTPEGQLVEVKAAGAPQKFEQLGDYFLTFPKPSVPMEVYFPGTFDIGLSISPAEL